MTYDANTSTYTWNRASVADIADIASTAYKYYACEIEDFLTPSAETVALNVGQDIIKQIFNYRAAYIAVARDKQTHQLLAYTYTMPEHTIFSSDPMAVIRLAHVDLTLSPRMRVTLITQMLEQIEVWAEMSHIPTICSTTIRKEQPAFLKIHERMGYIIRGSTAYKRIDK